MLSVRRLTASRGALASLAARATTTTTNSTRPSLAFAGKRLQTTHAGRGISSLTDPGSNLFPALTPLGGQEEPEVRPREIDPEIKDAQLRADIRAMGRMLGQVIQQYEGQDIFEKVEKMRALAKTRREAGAGRDQDRKEEAEAAFSDLAEYVSTFTKEELLVVSRAFSHFLASANAAEKHHTRRVLDEFNVHKGAFFDKMDSCGGVIAKLADEHSVEEVYEALSTQTVELVLTAHPTEVNRRTILDKHRRIQETLTGADALRTQKKTATDFMKQQLNDDLQREISSIWLTDEVSRRKPTPQTEAEKGVLIVETVLWETVPAFMRKLDATANEFLGRRLPLDAAPIRFASWMGGDRDGNPNVKPDTTREVILKNRSKAASLFSKDLRQLYSEVSLTTCSDELREVVGETREPYRDFLGPMIKKMELTEKWAEQERELLTGTAGADVHFDKIETSEIYVDKKALESDLLLMHRSLCATGNEVVADGFLTDILRNVSAFGLTLVPLDIRQESDKHEEAVDSITRFLGLGSYSQWDEQTKLNWLTTQLSSKRPLLRPGVWYEHPDVFSETAIDTLEISRMIAEQHEGSLGAYVISQATTASDVLAVLLLQRDAGVKNPLRVVPLFETLDDLNGAGETMKSLFSLPGYMGSINGKQEVMIGYSDSAKDAGRLAASWAQYETQEELAQIARDFNVDLTFFHGKGGTVGRGGNPQTFKAILAHAPDTINGHFRVTEQGEMIYQNFGHGDRAERTMDIYTSAILAEKLTTRAKPSSEWRDMMKKLSDISCDAYRRVVRGDERFVPYFRSATPELELSGLNIGSRPAKRKATGGVESLRAIPWNFAWTQTRFNLPTWLGVGEAIGEVLKGPDAELLRTMYSDWTSFRTTIDMVEMVLAKSDPSIAKHYDEVLVQEEKAKELGMEVRSLLQDTEEAVLDLTDHKILSEDNSILRRQLTVRDPYVDCLNVLQAETLKRIRSTEGADEDPILKDALMTTINGVANGMGNTG